MDGPNSTKNPSTHNYKIFGSSPEQIEKIMGGFENIISRQYLCDFCGNKIDSEVEKFKNCPACKDKSIKDLPNDCNAKKILIEDEHNQFLQQKINENHEINVIFDHCEKCYISHVSGKYI